MAYIAKMDGSREPIAVKDITRERAKEIVGGWVEAVYPRLTPDVVFLCDEEGHLKKKGLNAQGCKLYGGAIVGDIIVMTRAEARKAGWE